MHSIDGGKNWASGTGVGAAGIFRAVAFNGATFVAVGGASTTPIIWTSTDGVAWTSRTPGGTPDGYLTAITWDASVGLFVAVGADAECQTSPTGVTWTKRTLAGAGQDSLSGITAYSGLYVAVGIDTDDNSGVAQTSEDGINWSRNSLPVTAGGQTAVTHDAAGNYLSVGAKFGDSTVGSAYSSDDGVTWTLATELGSFLPLGVTCLDGVYVVCTDASDDATFGGHPAVMTSEIDPSEPWTPAHAPSAQESDGSGAGGTMWAIANDGYKFVVVGSGGSLSDSLTV
jgi:hypothetical protein